MSAASPKSDCVPEFRKADLVISQGSAQCSLWWRQTPQVLPHRVGCIGNFAVSEGRPINAVLHSACDQLQSNRCTLAIGPMDGSTWQSYRLVTQSYREIPFLFDVRNPPEWQQQFLQVGFYQIAAYFSSLVPDLSAVCREMTEQERRLETLGVHIRGFDPNRFEAELRTIYRIASEAFADNFLYTPISWTEFSLLYGPLREFFHHEFVLIAEMNGEPVGFIFAMPDLLQRRRRAEVDTVIIKSLGVLPAHKGLGLGSVLVERIHRSAKNQGYKRAIHALMHTGNKSARISAHCGQVFRRYGLFARHLEVQP